jgi:nucleoside-diphosphate-sugar epimerase
MNGIALLINKYNLIFHVRVNKNLQILVTGGAGYIGSVVIMQLLQRGHKVKCLDRFFFGKESLEETMGNSNLELIKDDTRWFDSNILKNVDAVLDLATLSNDPSGELDPSKTLDINYKGRFRVAQISKDCGVKRYVLASSCSIYGFNKHINDDNTLLDESSPIDPLTTYAKANAKAEEDIIPLASSKFTVTALRFATVYGYSTRMRFDLAINAWVLDLYKNQRIRVMRDGTQWRPFIHIKDAATAYQLILDASIDKINGQIFNVGFDEQNYQIFPLSEIIAKSLDLDYETDWYGSNDFRSYKVSFRKFKEIVNFKPTQTPKEGAFEIYEALRNGKLKETPKTKTVEWYKYLIDNYKLISEVTLKNGLL